MFSESVRRHEVYDSMLMMLAQTNERAKEWRTRGSEEKVGELQLGSPSTSILTYELSENFSTLEMKKSILDCSDEGRSVKNQSSSQVLMLFFSGYYFSSIP